MYRTTLVMVLLSAVAVSGCAPKLSLRDDLFQGQPLWESLLFVSKETTATAKQGLLIAADAPGLYLLAEQVLPGDKALAVPEQKLDILEPFSEKGLFTVRDRSPLPSEIAALSVTKAYVNALVAAYLGLPLAETRLTVEDFREFGATVLRSNFALYQSKGNKRLDSRLQKLRAFLDDNKLTLEGVTYTYFAAYYQGKFVDRTGGTLSKPKLGLKITNETITAAIVVGLEALGDYATITAKDIKNPVVWVEKEGKQVFQNAKNLKPTLVSVTQKLSGKTIDDPTVRMDFVVEPLQTDEAKPGITERKLEVIRLVSGYASDAAAASSDLIIRTFGGIHIGFVLLGKVSVGDNDTLAKIGQTIVDTTTERIAEMTVATYFYDKVKKKAKKGEAPALSAADLFGFED